MKKPLLALCLLLACRLLPAQAGPDYAALFHAQLRATCTGQVTWEKTITEVDAGQPETHRFLIDCATGRVQDPTTQEPASLPYGEFGYLFEQLATQPRIAPLYTIEQSGGNLHAVLKPEHDGGSALKKQNFEVDASGRLRYAESVLRKANTLYDLDISIRVWFDAEGRYERHETTTSSNVLLGGTVKTLIQGRIVP